MLNKYRILYKINWLISSKLVGVKRTTITNIERGSQSLSVLLLYKLANALDANLEELLPNIQRVIEGSDNISSNKYSLGDGAVELSVSESKSIMDALQKYRK